MKFINTSNTAIALRAKLEGGTSSKMKLTISVVGIPILEDGVTAVSYTHLDVYKRQAEDCRNLWKNLA